MRECRRSNNYRFCNEFFKWRSYLYGIDGHGTGSYSPNTEATHRFTSSSDGITFDFTFCEIDTGGDFLIFRKQDGQKYFFTGDLTGTRFSLSSPFVDVHFTTNGVDQSIGFDLEVIDGYEAFFDVTSLR
ncbi:Oidioi.mRNA.OKI2018_I69.chr1.g38.t1.cds [Oikopleura dioica]|uniref:Oidioi.mRNA.OKI2018_I69.chr1.g38.t1.cds n=1 Tax=Oikopleura dioica TaxID=34765 RepID=A0ABN7SIM1_OIKDI|nr:Oidioi.mRNA.OKI2018_I69.chr1.g38.t1.cds [Oikopleura dioica]